MVADLHAQINTLTQGHRLPKGVTKSSLQSAREEGRGCTRLPVERCKQCGIECRLFRRGRQRPGREGQGERADAFAGHESELSSPGPLRDVLGRTARPATRRATRSPCAQRPALIAC